MTLRVALNLRSLVPGSWFLVYGCVFPGIFPDQKPETRDQKPTLLDCRAKPPQALKPIFEASFAFLISVSLLAASLGSRPASGQTPTPRAHLALGGTSWHTVHIDGDALFFLIDELGVRFEKDGRFAVRVRFVDRQQTVKRGTYRLEAGTILVTIAGGKRKEIEYWTDHGNLIIRDKAYDVTARLAPGKMEDEGWSW